MLGAGVNVVVGATSMPRLPPSAHPPGMEGDGGVGGAGAAAAVQQAQPLRHPAQRNHGHERRAARVPD